MASCVQLMFLHKSNRSWEGKELGDNNNFAFFRFFFKEIFQKLVLKAKDSFSVVKRCSW